MKLIRKGLLIIGLFTLFLISVTVNAQSNPVASDATLTQTYTSADGSFSFMYPDGWKLDDTNPQSIILTGSDVEKVTVRIVVGKQGVLRFLSAETGSCSEEKLSTAAGLQGSYDYFALCGGNSLAPQTTQSLTPSGNAAIISIWHDKYPIVYVDLGNGIPALILESSQATPPTNIYSSSIAGTLTSVSSNSTNTSSTSLRIGAAGIYAYDTPKLAPAKNVKIVDQLLPIIGVNIRSDATWYQVEYQGELWWIRNVSTISVEGDASTIPLITDAGEPLPVSTNIPAPTEVATNSPTSIPASTSTNDVALTQTYTSTDGNFSFNYPDGMTVSEEKSKFSDASLIVIRDTSTFLLIAVGEHNISGTIELKSNCNEQDLKTNNGVKTTFEFVMKCSFLSAFTGQPQYEELGAKNAVTIDELQIIYLDLGNGIPVFMQGDQRRSEILPTIKAIAGSMEWHGEASTTATNATISTSDVALTQTYTAPDGSYSFKYPEGWTIDDSLPELLTIKSPSEGNTFAMSIGAHNLTELMKLNGRTCSENDLTTQNGIQSLLDNYIKCTGISGLFTPNPIEVAGKPALSLGDDSRLAIFIDLGNGVPLYLGTQMSSDFFVANKSIVLALAGSVEWHGSTSSSTSTPSTSTSTSDIALNQTFTSTNGNISFQYPDGLTVEESNQGDIPLILIKSSGSAYLMIGAGTHNVSQLLQANGSYSCPEDKISTSNGLRQAFAFVASCRNLGSIDDAQYEDLGGRQAAILASLKIVYIDLGNGQATFMQGNIGNAAASMDAIKAIAGSMEWHGEAVTAPTAATTTSAGGNLIAYRVSSFDNGSDVYVANADGSNPRNITNNPGSYYSPAWSPTGKFIAYANADGIFMMNADGTNSHKIKDGFGDAPTWSPDGSQIAFDAMDSNNNYQLYIMNSDGSDILQITNNYAVLNGQAWSPDGSQIAFASNTDGDMEIYVINVDGTNQQKLTNNTANDMNPAWSPDGSQIVYESDPAGGHQLYIMNADGTGSHLLSDTYATDAAWSPDGSQIAFTKPMDGEIFVINPDGTNLHRLTLASANDMDFHEDELTWQPTRTSAVSSVPPTPQPQTADSGVQLKLGTVYTSITTDQNGCGTEVNPTLSAHYGFYVVASASDLPKDTRLFVRLSHNGTPIEDAQEITADKDYAGVCVYFHFQSNGKDFDNGDYEGQFFINGEAGPSVKFTLQ